MKINAKLRKSINILARILFVAVSLWFIYSQVFAQDHFKEFVQRLSSHVQDANFILLLIVVVLLMPLNWGIETSKWRLLIAYIEEISFSQAFKSVLTGITMSLFTPNRMGEFFGRAFTLKKADPLKGALLTIAGSVSQLLVTLLAGFIAVAFYLPQYVGFSELWHKSLYAGLILFMVLLGSILVLGYVRTPFITIQLESFIRPSWNRIKYYLNAIEKIERRTLIHVLLLSALRYMVFSFQFYLLLLAFGLDIPYPAALVLIAMTYFVMAAIPTIALAELGIRGSVSIFFIGGYFTLAQNAAPEILAASTLIWAINLALPALLGMLFINRLKIVRKPKSETNGY